MWMLNDHPLPTALGNRLLNSCLAAQNTGDTTHDGAP